MAMMVSGLVAAAPRDAEAGNNKPKATSAKVADARRVLGEIKGVVVSARKVAPIQPVRQAESAIGKTDRTIRSVERTIKRVENLGTRLEGLFK
jgi:hypothetical protein